MTLQPFNSLPTATHGLGSVGAGDLARARQSWGRGKNPKAATLKAAPWDKDETEQAGRANK